MIERALGHDEVAANHALDRSSALGGDRRIQPEQAVTFRRIELPADPQQREPLPEQETVAELFGGRRVEASGRVVEESEHALTAAIGDFEENGAVAFLDPPRFDEKEIGGELDLA